MPDGQSEDSRVISLNNCLPLYQDLEEDPKCHLKCEGVGSSGATQEPSTARTPASLSMVKHTLYHLTKNEASAPKSNAKCILEKV